MRPATPWSCAIAAPSKPKFASRCESRALLHFSVRLAHIDDIELSTWKQPTRRSGFFLVDDQPMKLDKMKLLLEPFPDIAFAAQSWERRRSRPRGRSFQRLSFDARHRGLRAFGAIQGGGGVVQRSRGHLVSAWRRRFRGEMLRDGRERLRGDASGNRRPGRQAALPFVVLFGAHGARTGVSPR